MKSLDDVMAALPEPRRERIERKAARMIRATSLRQMREALRLTQTELSTAMGMAQNNLCRLESKEDMLLSTLQNYVASAGGRLRIIAEMPNDQKIELDLHGGPARIRRDDKVMTRG